MPTRLAFLGPVGTYGEQAARVLIEQDALEDVQLVPCVGSDRWWNSWPEGSVMQPLSRSRTRLKGVTATLDALWSHPELCIRRALVLPIQHALLGVAAQQVTEVLSHPQALAQCSGWLAQHLPDALQLPTSSTAEAARMVAGSPSGLRSPPRPLPVNTGWISWRSRLTMFRAIAHVFWCCGVGSAVRMSMWPVWRSSCIEMRRGLSWRLWPVWLSGA